MRPFEQSDGRILYPKYPEECEIMPSAKIGAEINFNVFPPMSKVSPFLAICSLRSVRLVRFFIPRRMAIPVFWRRKSGGVFWRLNRMQLLISMTSSTTIEKTAQAFLHISGLRAFPRMPSRVQQPFAGPLGKEQSRPSLCISFLRNTPLLVKPFGCGIRKFWMIS